MNNTILLNNFLHENFNQLEIDENNNCFDNVNKNCFLIRYVELEEGSDFDKDELKKSLNMFSYKDFNIIGIIIFNNVEKLIDINIFNERVLILLGKSENILEILKCIVTQINLLFTDDNSDVYTMFNELNSIKKNNIHNINKINSFLCKKFKTVLETQNESLFKELLFSNKINKTKILNKYNHILSSEKDIPCIKIRAKEYFKYKE